MKKLIRRLLLLIFIIIILVLGVFYFNGHKLYEQTLSNKSLKDKITEIRANKNFVKITEVPDYYINAIIAVEDHRYYDHGPVDYIALARAFVSNAKAKEFNEGGSTITQQVAKNLYFIGNDDDFTSRKVAETLIAIDLEKEYSKDEIIEIYINTIYFGEGYYGIKEAANGYYDKEPKDLNLNEATILAGVPNAPSVYNPVVSPKLSKSRQRKVLSDMVDYGYLKKEEMDKIISENE